MFNNLLIIETIICRLQQDAYQIAKVSKIIQLMEKGNAAHFKNKALDEIEIDMENIVENLESAEVEADRLENTEGEMVDGENSDIRGAYLSKDTKMF